MAEPAPAAEAPGSRLDARLVEVALKILAEEGIGALTLRRVARDAGVSHGAPQRHFRSRRDLLAEVAARGFRLLSEAIDEGGAPGPCADPIARLRAAGRAYVAVAVAHPDLFALMFRPEALDVTNPAFAEASRESFDRLLRHVRAAQDAGWQPGRATDVLAASVWAGVHGLATLWAQGAVSGAVPGASLDDVLTTTLELVLDRP